jgi:protein involved in polysaccharide export with SLBB domain
MVRTILTGMNRLTGRAGWLPALLLVIPAAAAQTPQQVEIFQSLTPEQQQQVLDQLGRTGVSGMSLPQPGTAPAPTTPAAGAVEGAIPINLPAATAPGAVAELVPRLKSGDTLLLDVSKRLTFDPLLALTPEAPEEPEEDRAFDELRKRILSANPYRLDRTGQLVLPGPIRITLAGLTAEEASQRLNSDPQFENINFWLQFLPVEPDLKPFGYDLFTNVPTTFAPASDIPVPTDYVVGPGDTLQLQLIGEGGGWYTLVVGRDGVVNMPELGPVAVAGMRFDAAKALLEDHVAQQMIGMRASVSMGPLRSVQVFVLGEAVRPGSFTVGGLSTISNALFASGGVKPIGSLRDIQFKRNGGIVGRLDLYDLLLNGDTKSDIRLQSGDAIFIPPVGKTVSVTGEVRRPAIYELKDGETIDDLVRFAGGLTPEADASSARIERIDDRGNRTYETLALTPGAGAGAALRPGDVVIVDAIRGGLENGVKLVGHVRRSGGAEFRPGMRITDLVGSLDELQPLADTRYVLVRRESGPDRRVSAISVDLAEAFADPASGANVALQARDTVYVFDLARSRERVVLPILAELERQSSDREPQQVVSVSGRVKIPGEYPLEPGMTVSDLLRAAGGLDQAAFPGEAELTRYQTSGGARRESLQLTVRLDDLSAGVAEADFELHPFDHLVIKEMPEWSEQESMVILGEVRFPGEYPIRRGETLRSVIERAGGLTDLAFIQGSVFTRRDLKEREQRQLEVLAERLQRDLASLSLQQAQSGEAGATQAISAGQQLLSDLRSTRPVGRLVISLDESLASLPGSPGDLLVRDGDQLLVPRLSQEVTVIGEVQNSTSHLFRAGLTRDDYIRMSGGVTQRADSNRTFIIRADGSVAAGEAGGWFSRGAPKDIRQGDTIVVPIDAERMRPLSSWLSITQVLYNIAVAVAAVNSF